MKNGVCARCFFDAQYKYEKNIHVLDHIQNCEKANKRTRDTFLAHLFLCRCCFPHNIIMK